MSKIPRHQAIPSRERVLPGVADPILITRSNGITVNLDLEGFVTANTPTTTTRVASSMHICIEQSHSSRSMLCIILSILP